MSKIDEFKGFVRKHPELSNYVHSNNLTWQNLYEDWSMYGEDERVWNKYKETPKQKENLESPIGDLMNMVKGVNINNLSKNITTLQKAISLVQEIIKKDDNNSTKKEPYTPRPLYKHFED